MGSFSRQLSTGLLNLVAVLVIYFVVPAGEDMGRVRIMLGVVGALAAAGIVAAILVRETSSGSRNLKFLHLVLLAEIALVAFALAYYLVAINGPEQFFGLTTRLDALYFTATTISTVGYGDIYASGQFARGLVLFNFGFNVVFVAILARLINARFVERQNAVEHPAEHPAGPSV